MQGRISTVLAGVALAIGGGVAGAAVVTGTADDDPFGSGAPAAERGAAEAIKIAKVRVGHALSVAQRARRIARRGRAKANLGLATANALLDSVDEALADAATALATAQQADTDATTALNRADNAQSELDSTRVVSDTAAGTATVPADDDYHAAPDGPRVTVTVPSSGMIEVWATITVDSTEGAAALFRDGQLVEIPGQDITGTDVCGANDALLASNLGDPVTISTPPNSASFGVVCGTIGDSPSPVLFNQPPGEHTYELRYSDCGCDADEAVVSDRTLRIAPRL